jgi:hypothetical protein
MKQYTITKVQNHYPPEQLDTVDSLGAVSHAIMSSCGREDADLIFDFNANREAYVEFVWEPDTLFIVTEIEVIPKRYVVLEFIIEGYEYVATVGNLEDARLMVRKKFGYEYGSAEVSPYIGNSWRLGDRFKVVEEINWEASV